MENSATHGILLFLLSTGSVSTQLNEEVKNSCLRHIQSAYTTKYSYAQTVFNMNNYSIDEDNTTLRVSVGLSKIIYYTSQDVSNLELEFNANVTIGSVSCKLEKNTSTERQDILPEEVRQKLDKVNLLSENFWNFSSPKFGETQNWFQSLMVSGDFERISCNWLNTLHNTSIQKLIIPHICRDVEDFVPKDMPLLQTLDLSNNKIKALHDDAFIGSPELQYLYLRENELENMPAQLSRIPKLKYLDISSNSVLLISYNLNSDRSALQQLHTFKLSNSKIAFSLRSFSSLSNLTHLWLDGCNIFVFENNTFEAFRKLKYLNLSRVELNINMYTFSSLPNLTMLDLSRNSNKKLPVFYSSNLENVIFSHNNITKLNEMTLHIENVTRLDLSHNRIMEWENTPDFFCRLNEIHLDFNNISILTHAMRIVLDGINNTYLHGNPFNCLDCQMQDVQKWLNTRLDRIRDLKNMLCHIPNAKPEISFVQFSSYNQSCYHVSHWRSVGVPLGTILCFIVVIVGVIFFCRRNIASKCVKAQCKGTRERKQQRQVEQQSLRDLLLEDELDGALSLHPSPQGQSIKEPVVTS